MNYLVVDRWGHTFARTCTLHVAKILAHALSLEEENVHEPMHVMEEPLNGSMVVDRKGHGYYLDGEFYDF